MRAYFSLLDATHHAVWNSPSTQTEEAKRAAPGPISHNFILTLNHMTLVPRLREASALIDPPMSINSLGFAGMLLCMSNEELARLQAVDGGIRGVLRSVGVEPPSAKPVEEGELASS